MTLYACEVTRTDHSTIYVEADSAEQAEVDARELMLDLEVDWEPEDVEVLTSETSTAGPFAYWTGGDNGHWVYPTDGGAG